MSRILEKSSTTGRNLVETLDDYRRDYEKLEQKYANAEGSFMLGYYSGIVDLLGLVMKRVEAGEFDKQ